MKLAISPRGIAGPKRSNAGFLDMSRAGFRYSVLDFSVACGTGDFMNMTRAREEAEKDKRVYLPDAPDRLGEVMEEFVQKSRENGMELPIAYAPFLPRDRKADVRNTLICTFAKESVRLAIKEKCEAIVIRPLYAGIPMGKEWEVNREFYLSLAELAAGSSLSILLENQCRDSEGHMVRGVLSDSVEAAQWIDDLNRAVGEKRFGFCLDIGVLSLCGQDMYEFIETLGNRLKAVILRDCDGHDEQSLLPFTSISKEFTQTDWLSLIRGLRETAFNGTLILNIADTTHWVPVILRPQLMALAFSMMQYFEWQINMEAALKKYQHVVLFGAGNMCRNYLKNYGEKYPPLFTCDNNSERWGEDFYGLTIHDPKDLLELPEGTGIFICNMYYREIENQLREMGITNGIEYFNDEYLQTFYMDRLKGL